MERSWRTDCREGGRRSGLLQAVTFDGADFPSVRVARAWRVSETNHRKSGRNRLADHHAMSSNKELWEAVAYNKAAEVAKQLAGGADPNWSNESRAAAPRCTKRRAKGSWTS